MKWLPKLIGYDYEVIYKMGLKNGAADALCRLGNASELICMFVSSITTVLMQRVKDTGGEVTWSNGTTEDASWEDLEKLVKDFPAFDMSS
ncbi:hypothetical protein Tco_1000539 [Tanacetum coccineum]